MPPALAVLHSQRLDLWGAQFGPCMPKGRPLRDTPPVAEQAGGPSYKEPGQSRGEPPQQVLHHPARSSFKNSGHLARRGGRRFRTTVQRWMGTIFYTVHDGRPALVQMTRARLQLIMGRQPRRELLLHIWHRIAAVHRTLLLDLAQRRFARRFCETILIFFFWGRGSLARLSASTAPGKGTW